MQLQFTRSITASQSILFLSSHSLCFIFATHHLAWYEGREVVVAGKGAWWQGKGRGVSLRMCLSPSLLPFSWQINVNFNEAVFFCCTRLELYITTAYIEKRYGFNDVKVQWQTPSNWLEKESEGETGGVMESESALTEPGIAIGRNTGVLRLEWLTNHG